MSVTTGPAPTGGAAAIRPRGRRPMNPWRLEWLRMTRSPRGAVLILVYAFFGLVGPVMARFMPEIAKLASEGVKIIVPPPEPADGILNYVDQGSQTGMLVVIVVAAGAFSFDARRGLGMFYRTRAHGAFALLWPRLVVNVAVAVLAYATGTAAAWFETGVVLGGLPAGRVLLGVLLEAVFLAFAIAVVAAAATLGRGSTLSTVLISIVVLLLVLPVAGIIGVVADWLPSSLLTAPATLLTRPGLAGYARAVLVSVPATAGLIALAVRRSGSREL